MISILAIFFRLRLLSVLRAKFANPGGNHRYNFQFEAALIAYYSKTVCMVIVPFNPADILMPL
jgi:hypothetical protein